MITNADRHIECVVVNNVDRCERGMLGLNKLHVWNRLGAKHAAEPVWLSGMVLRRQAKELMFKSASVRDYLQMLLMDAALWPYLSFKY